MTTVRHLIGLEWSENNQAGVNCWGLFRLARQLLENKFDLPSYQEEYKVPLQYSELERLIKTEKDLNWKRIQMGEEEPGDLILLKRKGFFTHVGYVTRRGWMLHIEEQTSSVEVRYPSLENPMSKIGGFYRYG